MDKSNKFIEMTVFTTLVEIGSFVETADRLNISKQAVSRYINALEKRLQTRLLQRTTRKMSLTPEGQDFYLQAKSILDSVDEAESSIHPTHADPIGLIRVNVPVSFGILHLAPLWQKFMDKYPKISLEITLADRVVDLIDEGVDLAIRIGQLSSSSLISRKLATTKITLAASPTYLARYHPLSHPNDLPHHHIIAYSHWSRKERWRFKHDNQEIDVQVHPKVFCNNGDTCRVMMLQHGGISLQPEFIIGKDIQEGKLVEVLPEYKLDDYNIYAVYPSRKLLPLRLRCLIDFLIEGFKDQDWS